MNATERPDRPRRPGEPSRSLWPAALLTTGVLAVLIVVFVAVYPDDGSGNDTSRTGAGVPSIIEKPEDGRPPERPGDPGGWEQLALFGVVVAGLGTVVAFVWRSSRKARRGGSP